MQFGSRSRILAIAAVVLVVGTIAGLSIGRSMYTEIVNNRGAEPPSDPVQRYELGQNAFKPPQTGRLPSNARTAPDENQEYGRHVNGRRILVPSEPAMKKERLRLLEEQRQHNQWHDDYFGAEEADDLQEGQDIAVGIPAEEYDRPVGRGEAEARTARLNASSSRKTASTAETDDSRNATGDDQSARK